MDDLKIFRCSEFGELSVLIIDDKEFFPATQCARILGYKDCAKAIRQHCKGDGGVKRPGVSYTTNQHGVTTAQVNEIKYISEGNLYRLVVHSQLPAAERFERWVFDEVLPELRKSGTYGTVNIEEIIAKTATAVVSEVVKQLAPVILHAQPAISLEEVPTRKRLKAPIGIMGGLDPEILRELDDMIVSERYTYCQMMDFLAKEFGIKVCYSTMQRYAIRLLKSLK